MENFKRVKIYTQGMIEPKGCIYGPILTPYKEKLETIFNLISANYHVVEVLPDGKEVILTTSNYDKDNTVEGRKEEASKVEESTSKVETITVEDTASEEVVVNENNQKSYHINKNKNKKNKSKDFTPDKMESI